MNQETDDSMLDRPRIYYGTRAVLNTGDLIGPTSSNRSGATVEAGTIYCTADLDAALWEAELAAGEGPGRVYIVEPLGGLEDVANEADKRTRGHPLMTLRSGEPLRVVAELTEFPLYHGTRADLKPGDLIEPGHNANFGSSPRSANYVYVTQTLDAAAWGAELAAGDVPGRIYVVEPTGPIEEDPNLTNRRFRGNPSRSYRSRAAFRVVGEVVEWRGHEPEVVEAMQESLERLNEKGIEPDD
jgi:hypothetical protein